jgi:uncharacterized protein
MTVNKSIIEKYIDGFNKLDHEQILSCLSDDVEWIIPGMFHIRGKAAFDKEIENDAFVGKPQVLITRMVEENNFVAAEGTVQSQLRSGSSFRATFCDVFVMEHGKIRKLTSYLVEIK